MKTLIIILTLITTTVSAADLVLCFRERPNKQVKTFFKIKTDKPTDPIFLYGDLQDVGIETKALDGTVVIIDLESKLIVLDRRKESKLYKLVPPDKMKLFKGFKYSTPYDINEYYYMMED